MKGGREAELARLFSSIKAFRRCRPDIVVRHYLLLQQCEDAGLARAKLDAPPWVEISITESMQSLSAARNRLLSAVFADGLDAKCLIAFPDDDAWYPPGTLERIVDAFSTDRHLDFWFCRYGSTPTDFSTDGRVPSCQEVISCASSNTIMLRGPLAEEIGNFDERLGLGTPAQSGEDTDYAIRSYLHAHRTVFVNSKLIGHRDYNPGYRARYYAGATIAINRHAFRSAPLFCAFVRKLAVGVALVLRGEMKIAALRMAVVGPVTTYR